MTENLPSPFMKVERNEWKTLREREKINITEEELLEIRGINENLSINEVDEIYAPISKLLRMYYENYEKLITRRADFFRKEHEKIPYIIGIAGSVAVGKSTTARILRALISGWPSKPNVYIVTTDGFLFSNSELEKRKLMERKGFPESYDLRKMIKFLYDLKSGVRNLRAPIYSHLLYDIVEDQFLEIKEPDIIIFEGLNVLQTNTRAILAKEPELLVSDFFDFSIYVDAEEVHIKKWFLERFKILRETRFKNPESYFRGYYKIPEDEAVRIASDIWDRINGKNLRENIENTKYHAHLILKKEEDHSVSQVMIRKI